MTNENVRVEELGGEERSAIPQNESTLLLSSVDFIYVSSAGVTANNWDIRIALGDRHPSGKVVPKVGIVMSHPHAKALLKVLGGILEALEKQIGTIPLPEPASKPEKLVHEIEEIELGK